MDQFITSACLIPLRIGIGARRLWYKTTQRGRICKGSHCFCVCIVIQFGLRTGWWVEIRLVSNGRAKEANLNDQTNPQQGHLPILLRQWL